MAGAYSIHVLRTPIRALPQPNDDHHLFEECDDGNRNTNDGCTNTCRIPFCGDDSVRTGVEECDSDEGFNSGACVEGCKLAKCGDGHVRRDIVVTLPTDNIQPRNNCQLNQDCMSQEVNDDEVPFEAEVCHILVPSADEDDDDQGICGSPEEDLADHLMNHDIGSGLESAMPVEVNAETEFHLASELYPAEDQDFFTFTLDHNEATRFAVFTKGPTDTVCTLYDGIGRPIAENDDNDQYNEGNNCYIEFRSGAEGFEQGLNSPSPSEPTVALGLTLCTSIGPRSNSQKATRNAMMGTSTIAMPAIASVAGHAAAMASSGTT